MSYDDNTDFDDANPPEESGNRMFHARGWYARVACFTRTSLYCGLSFLQEQFQPTDPINGGGSTYSTTGHGPGGGYTDGCRPGADSNSSGHEYRSSHQHACHCTANSTFTATANPATATVGAAFTQIANSTQTIIPTSTALPNTGFADDVGAPGLILLAIVLVVVIFLVRRLESLTFSVN